MKTCSKCQESKPLDGFNRDKGKRDGRRGVCRECQAANSRAWADRNRDHLREYNREWRAANPGAASEAGKRWRADNPDYSRDRYAANPDAYAKRRENGDRSRNRYVQRARSYGLEPVSVRVSRAEIVAAYGDACTYCRGPFEEIDHVVPVALGGAHVLANLRPSCTRCNRREGAGIATARRVVAGI